MNRNVIVEAVGTFFLALVAALSGNALAVGCVLMVMIYAGGHISGGHYNPAVTFGVLLRGKTTFASAITYWVGQGAAAVAAVIIALVWKEKGDSPSFPFEGMTFVRMILGEIIGTFALVYVVLNVATVKATEGNPFYGAAIGLTVFAMASTFGGASFNPAVALTLALSQKAPYYMIFSALIGAPVGAFAAAILTNLLQGDHKTSLSAATAGSPPPPPAS